MNNIRNSLNEKYPMKCCFCGGTLDSFLDAHNPAPLANKPEDKCCVICNNLSVIPARIKIAFPAGTTNGEKKKSA